MKFWKQETEASGEIKNPNERRRFRFSLFRRGLKVPRELNPASEIAGGKIGATLANEPTKTATFTINSDLKNPEPAPLSDAVVGVGESVLEMGQEVAGGMLTAADVVETELGSLAEGTLESIGRASEVVEKLLSPGEANSVAGTVPSEKKKDPPSLYSLPLGWSSLKKLKEFSLLGNRDITAIRPSENLYVFIPMVASVVVNKRKPERPIRVPTYAEAKYGAPFELQDLMGIAEFFLSIFSKKYLARFKAHVETQAAEEIEKVGRRIAEAAFIMEEVKNPRAQALKELEMLYRALSKPLTAGNETLSIERKVSFLLSGFWRIKRNPRIFDEVQHPFGLNSRDYPILMRLLPLLNLPPDSVLDEMQQKYSVSAVGSEIMQGIETFLWRKRISDLPSAPEPTESTIADPDTWTRGLGEMFAEEQIKNVKSELPEILACLIDGLPEDGALFADSVFEMAENIVEASSTGVGSREIGRKLFTLGEGAR